MQMLILNPPRKARRKGPPMARKARRRKWGSPKQRAALRKMLAANRRGKSPRRARRKARRNPPAHSGVPTMARKRSRRRSVARTFRRARRRAAGIGRGFGKFVPAGTIPAVAGGVGGFVLAQMLTGKLADMQAIPASFKTGYGRIALKAAAAIAAGYFARRFAGRQLGNAIGTGALVSVGLDVVNVALNKPALSGYSPGGDNNYGVLPGPDGVSGYDDAGVTGYEPALAGDGLYN